MLHIPTLFISETETKGRGVFVGEDIPEGTIIEICPLLLIPPKDVPLIHQTVIHDYYFWCPDEDEWAFLPLGYGCLYNHSTTDHNAITEHDFEEKLLRIYAIKDIAAGNEILIDYNGGEKENMLWFEEQK